MDDISLLVVGDLHFQEKGLPRYSRMVQEILRVTEKAHLQQNIDAVVLLGDILHFWGKADQAPFDLARVLIVSLAKLVPVYLIIGNHDYISNDQVFSERHFFNPYKEMNNIIVIDRPYLATIKNKHFAMMPYLPSNMFLSFFNTHFDIEKTKITAVFGHQEFGGAQMGAIVSEAEVYPDNYPLAVMGHIHEFQIISENLIYVGTPIQHKFGDGSDKGIYLFSFSDDDHQMVKYSLSVPLKKIFRITAEEATGMTVPEGIEAKIKIVCSKEEYKALERSGVIEQLQSIATRVEHQDSEAKKMIVPITEIKPFTEVLYDRIRAEPSLIKCYQQVFSSD